MFLSFQTRLIKGNSRTFEPHPGPEKGACEQSQPNVQEMTVAAQQISKVPDAAK